MMMEMQMVEGRYFWLWQELLRKQIVNLSSKNLWIFLAPTGALGVAGRLDLLSVMTSSGYYLANFFILSFISSPTYGLETYPFLFVFSHFYRVPCRRPLNTPHTSLWGSVSFQRVQGGNSEVGFFLLMFNPLKDMTNALYFPPLLLITIIFRLTLAILGWYFQKNIF